MEAFRATMLAMPTPTPIPSADTIAEAMPPNDRLGRPLHDLRISVTDRCNFRCAYCMAETNGSKNGARQKDKVRVAIIGVGNCANSLLQGIQYYKDADPEQFVPGLMHVDVGGYHIRDI